MENLEKEENKEKEPEPEDNEISNISNENKLETQKNDINTNIEKTEENNNKNQKNLQDIDNNENEPEESENEIEEEKEDIKIIKNEDDKEEMKINNKEEEEEPMTDKIFRFLKTGFSWRPIPSITSTVLCLEISGGIFLVLGIVIMVLSSQIVDIEIRYDNNPDCEIDKDCTINFSIEKDMKQTVMVYYRMKNFYQNHRRYIKSKSNKQLKGNKLKPGDIKGDCEPIVYNKDIYDGVKSINGLVLNPNDTAHPCGLIAKSFFNDTYKLYKNGDKEEIIIKENGIAWTTDIKKFKNSDNYLEHQWKNVEDERFMVWMRPAALPDFRKLWGRIEKDLNKGEYSLIIKNNYPVKPFKGEKYFVLSTVNALGGRNKLLGIAYLILAGICLAAGIMFFIGYKIYNRDEKNVKIE